MQKYEQSVKDIFNNKQTPLGKILAKLDYLTVLTKQLHELIEPNLRAGCCVANLRDNCLIVQIDNAAIATQLRYQSVELLSQFRKQGQLPSLASIQFIVRPKDALLL